MFLTIVTCVIIKLFVSLTKGDFINSDDSWIPTKFKSIVGGREAAPPPEDDPVAFAIKDDHFAKVFGKREGKYPNSYYRFTGIRYAEPPVGKYRFQRPKRVKLSGDVSGLKNPPPCPQPDPDNPEKVIGSEDCLFLNVFTPRLPTSDPGLPVLLWIHGGGFRRGSASQYGGGYFARKDVVLVAAQYRLGTLGFLSTGEKELPGNAAMFDLAAAVNWIKDYIEFFGGDPKNIIPFGQGTGASSAVLLGLSNITQGRVGGIIAMSGSALSPFAIDDHPKDTTTKLAEKNKCPHHPPLEMVKCLQQLPLEKLIQADSWLEKLEIGAKGLVGMGSILTPAAVVEDSDDIRFLPPYLSEPPRASLDLSHMPKIPLLTGVTKHETAGAITGGFKNQILEKLKSIPNFLDKVLLKDLVDISKKQLYSAAATGASALKFLSGNYINLKATSLEESINQVIEATSDALFNFPAYETGSAWSKQQLPTFFYSFDHAGKVKGASKLLKGSVLMNHEIEDEGNNVVSHGADLPYLFDIRSLDGTVDPVQNESTVLQSEDESVRNLFLNLITDFAKTKSVKVGDKQGVFSFPSYLSILPKPTVGEHYRQCQMALWSGTQTLKTCPPLNAVTGALVKGFGKVSSVIPGSKGVETVKNKINVPGLSLG